jgi:hypothetical protein
MGATPVIDATVDGKARVKIALPLEEALTPSSNDKTAQVSANSNGESDDQSVGEN